ncbi:hypothetical protein CDL15_Pgr016521 [Punica granatum]|uniref:Uncharacterized protein n=1 Tax=Punica granatum TaxID=22663 RepID=A0A218XEC4_PUNGR|nr:hypothetical protein CDL15_Pgr016521 [Punica granatum]
MARFYSKGSTSPQRSQATSTPRAAPTPLSKPKAPPRRLCVQSYGPSGRKEIGFVANSSTLARRSRTTGSFRRS